MQEHTIKSLGYYGIFWLWVLLVEPTVMQIAGIVVHEGATSIFLSVLTGAALILETLVWRSKVAHMKTAHTFPKNTGLVTTLWVGHMLGSMIVLIVFCSALGIFNLNATEFTPLNFVVLLLMMGLVIKEIVFLMNLMDDTPQPARYSLNKTNSALLFATLIMHSCFWGLATSSGAPLHTYGFLEMLLVQAPMAGLLFLISYLPSRVLPFLEEYATQGGTRAGRWSIVGYTAVTMLLALKVIY